MKKRKQISKLDFEKVIIIDFNQTKGIYGGTNTGDTNTGGGGLGQNSGTLCTSFVVTYPIPEPIVPYGPQPQP